MEIYELKPDQKKALANLKRAISACSKAKIGFCNVLDTTYVFNKEYIKSLQISDYKSQKEEEGHVPCHKYGYTNNSFQTVGGDSFADDQIDHYFVLTEKGKSKFKAELSDNAEDFL
jgi:hypothetical protein